MPDPADIARAIRELVSRQLLIGITQDHDPRPDEPIGNASLGYVHELGSPARNIPARPHLVPGVEAALGKMTPQLERAAKAALDGNIAAIDAALGGAGQLAVDSVKATIQAGIPPPLQPATVLRRKAGRNRRRREAKDRGISLTQLAKEEIVSGAVTPLIDTADYINSQTWVIRKR